MESSLALVPSQWCKIVPPLRHLVCEEHKHSASVQSLLITPKTGLVDIQRWGGDVDTSVGLSRVFRTFNPSFSHGTTGGSWQAHVIPTFRHTLSHINNTVHAVRSNAVMNLAAKNNTAVVQV